MRKRKHYAVCCLAGRTKDSSKLQFFILLSLTRNFPALWWCWSVWQGQGSESCSVSVQDYSGCRIERILVVFGSYRSNYTQTSLLIYNNLIDFSLFRYLKWSDNGATLKNGQSVYQTVLCLYGQWFLHASLNEVAYTTLITKAVCAYLAWRWNDDCCFSILLLVTLSWINK